MKRGIGRKILDFRLGVLYLVEQPPHCDLLRLSLRTTRFVLLEERLTPTQKLCQAENVHVGFWRRNCSFFSRLFFSCWQQRTSRLCHVFDLLVDLMRFYGSIEKKKVNAISLQLRFLSGDHLQRLCTVFVADCMNILKKIKVVTRSGFDSLGAIQRSSCAQQSSGSVWSSSPLSSDA